MRVNAAFPSHPETPRMTLRFIHKALKSLGWLASGKGDPGRFKAAYMQAFPNLVDFTKNFLQISELSIEVEDLNEHTNKIHMSVPVDHRAAKNYNVQMAEALNLFNPFHVEICHPRTNALLLSFTIADGEVHISFGMRCGKLAWMGNEYETSVLEWDRDDFCEIHVVVECSLVPLGVTLAAIPFPAIRLQCWLDRAGAILVRCIDVEESADDTLASVALDMQAFRRLLMEQFRVELQHSCAGDDPAQSTMQFTVRALFPSSSVSTLLSQWFEEFIIRRLTATDPFKTMADLLTALGQDSFQLSQNYQ